jgi:hypothetical protein
MNQIRKKNRKRKLEKSSNNNNNNNNHKSSFLKRGFDYGSYFYSVDNAYYKQFFYLPNG